MSKPYSPDPTKIAIALDYKDEESALGFIRGLKDRDLVLKVGLELFTSAGPEFVKTIRAEGFDIFLDLKLYDIPNTVSQTAEKIANLGIQYFTLHLGGGRKMMETTRSALERFGEKRPKILGVSVLTSFNENGWREVASRSISESVKSLVDLGVESGVDGIVCSPLEIQMIRENHKELLIVTPGVRLAGTDSHDQARVMTPSQAKSAGANLLVIGRPITQAIDPNVMISQIKGELQS